MASEAFSFSGDTSISAITTATNLLFVSTSASDSGTVKVIGVVSGTPTVETVTLAGTSLAQTTNSFSSVSAVVFSTALIGTVTISNNGTAALGDARVDTNLSDGATLQIGHGTVRTYAFKNSPASAYDVKIGVDTDATAANLKAAINADGTGDGTDYAAGTLIHPEVSATVATSVVSLTDRFATGRATSWTLTDSASNFSLRSLIGGEDGATLSTVAIGGLSAITSAFSLNDEPLTADRIPALFTGKSDTITTGGAKGTLHIKAENVTSAVVVTLEESLDGVVWSDSGETIANLDNNEQTILVDHHTSRVRLSIDTNANVDAVSLSAFFVYS